MKSLTQLMEGFVSNSMNSVTNGFTDLITGAKSVKDAFKDMASSIINDLIRMLIQYYITQQVFSAITGAIGGGSTGGATSGGGKAIGGSVQAGKPYMVGERGQELFIPNQSGSIVSNDKLGGGGGVVVNQVINVSTGVQQTVRAEIQNLMPQIANSAKAAVAETRMRGGSYSKALVGA
jgi:phage-related minor tail protein